MAGSHFPSPRYCPSCGSCLARDNTDVRCSPCRQKAQDAVRHPPKVPPEFWHTDELRNGLASRHIGVVIRAYRHHPFHGPRPLAQELVGNWLGLTQAQLSRLEHSRPYTNLDRLIAWALALHIPEEHLWFKLPNAQSNPEPDVAFASLSLTQPCDLETDGEFSAIPEDGEDMDRTEFLVLGGSALASFLASPLVHDWKDSKNPPATPDLTDVTLDQVHAQTEGFRWLDRKDGSSAHMKAATRHAHNLTRFWRVTDDTHPLRPELAEIAADACQLVAAQAFDQGTRLQAIEWYRCSADLAARAGNQDLYVFAVCGVAYMHAKNGEAGLALSDLHQLSALPLSAAARCYATVYEAHAYASARRLDPAFRALDRAMAYSEQTPHEAPPSWVGISHNSFVERHRANILAQFGESEALRILERLDQDTPGLFRDYRVTLGADQAMTYAHLGQVEPCAAALTSAVLLNQLFRSIERTRRILDVRARLDPYQDSRPVKALDEVIQATKVRELLRGR